MPWPQLPTGKDIADTFKGVGIMFIMLMVLGFIGTGVSLHCEHQEAKKAGITLSQKKAREEAAKLDEEIKRLQQQKESALKRFDDARN